MNTNTNSSGANLYLKRIQKTSRALKIMLLVYLGCLVIFLPSASLPSFHKTAEGYWTVLNITYATWAQVPLISIVLALVGMGLLVAAFVAGYQLLGLYERGIIFTTNNVRLFRRIGFLVISYGVLSVGGQTFILAWQRWLGSTSVGFGNVLLWEFGSLLMSPWVIGGIFLTIVAHIMGEGCKLQEEQELTV